MVVFSSLLVLTSGVACTSILGDFDVVATTATSDGGGTDAVAANDVGAPVDTGSDAPTDTGFTAISVAAGGNHTCAVKAPGVVYCWGNNQNGQLGILPSTLPKSNKPFKVPNFGAGSGTGKAIKKVWAGGTHTCALDLDGSLFCWGGNDSGQLGTAGAPDPDAHPDPKRVAAPDGATGFLTGVADASLGDTTSCAVLSSGDTVCWGNDRDLQAGVSPPGTSILPRKLPSPVSAIKTASVGATHGCAVGSASGSLYCWGKNTSGEVPNGSPLTPPTTVSLSETPFSVAAGGTAHTCITAGASQTIYCFGNNAAGQLGIAGDGGSTSVPTAVMVGDSGATFQTVLTGGNTSCAMGSDANSIIGCWGTNAKGQLGLGARDDNRHDSLAPVVGIGPAIDLSVGSEHVCAIGKRGDANLGGPVYCWGAGNFGKLGIDANATDDSPTPKPVIVE